VQNKKLTLLKIINFSLAGLFAGFFALTFLIVARSEIDITNIKIEQEFAVSSSRVSKSIELPLKTNYVLQIKYDYRNTDSEKLLLNGKRLKLRVSNETKNIVSRYYYIDEQLVRIGENRLKLQFLPTNPPSVDIRIRNYIFSNDQGNIMLALKKIHLNEQRLASLIGEAIIFFVLLCCLWTGLAWLGKKGFNLNSRQCILNNVISFALCLSIFFFIAITSYFGPFVFIVKSSYYVFYGLVCVSILCVLLHLFSLLLIQFSAEDDLNSIKKSKCGKAVENRALPVWLVNCNDWFKMRTLSDKCFIYFVLSFLISSILLGLSNVNWADIIMNFAYIVLVMGMVIKFVEFSNSKKNN